MHSTKTKQIVAGFVGIAMALSFVFAGAVAPAKAATVEELTAQISSLLSTIASLQSQLSAMQGGSASVSTGTGFTFTTDLKLGSTGEAVKQLQILLNKSADTQVASTGAGSPGKESTYFGPATKAAVIKFQNKFAADVLTPVGLKAGTGFVGAATRAKLNAMSAGTTTGTTGGTTTTVPAGNGLSVAAATQPQPQLAPESAARVPFTKIVLTAGSSDVTVNGITVTRVGPASDTDFAGIVLLDQNGQQVGVAKTLNSNHQATVGDTFTVKAGTSVTYTIGGNMATDLSAHAGEVPALQVTAINTNVPVTGSLPITGTGQTTNATLTLGSVTMNTSSFDPSTGSTQNIGTTGYRFAGVKVTAGSAEDVRLLSIRWNQSGSASASDLANIVTVVDGTQYPTTLSSDGKYYTTTFGNGIVIPKGFSKDIYVQGDIVGSGAANRTVQFDIYKTTDLSLSGETYGYGITPPAGTGTLDTTRQASNTSKFTTSNPWFEAATITIGAGSATTISNASSVAAQNIAINVPNQVLGGYTTDIKGEPISVQQSVFEIASSSSNNGTTNLLLTNVSIVDENGAVVAGPVDAVAQTATACGSNYCSQKLTFTDTVTYPTGKHTYTLKGKVASGVANNTSYTVNTTPSTDWTTVTGQTTGNNISLSSFSSNIAMNPMTVKTAALAVAVSSNPAAQTITPGTVGQLFTNFQLDASQSGEDVRLSSMGLTLTPTTVAATNLTGCQMFDGTTALNTGANVLNPTGNTVTVSFDNALVIPKGTVKTLSFKCNMDSSSSGSYAWGITSTQIGAISITGVTSGNSVTATGSTQTGPLMSLGAASLAVSTDVSSPSYTLAPAGQTGVTLGIAKFHATNDSINLKQVGLILTNTASSSSSDLVQVTLWNGATQVGSAVFTGTNTHATSTLSVPVNIPKDGDVSITIKGDLSAIGVSAPADNSGDLIAVDVESSTNTYGTNAGNGQNTNSTGSTSVAGVRMMKSVPVLAQDTLSSSGVADGRLLRFKVTADNAGSIGIAQMKLTFSTTSATVTGVNVFGFADSAYSQPISGVSTGGQISSSNLSPNSTGVVTVTPQTTGGTNTTVQVPAGSTRYFEVRGTVAGTATTYSVTTTLSGDTAYPSVQSAHPMSSTTGITSSSNFVWSPNSTSTSVRADEDWTNGYGLLGLPSSGIIQTRTN